MTQKWIRPSVIVYVAVATLITSGCAVDATRAASFHISEQDAPIDNEAKPQFLVRSTKALSLLETADEYENNAWKKAATADDQDRIYSWVEALYSGVSVAEIAGEGEKIKQGKGLFDSDALMADGAIPSGLYNCAITKLGGPDDSGLPFIAYPAFRCRVTEDDGRLHFTKLTGSQRTVGWIYRASNRHSVYLGTSFYGYENKAVPYGETKERDQAAVVQRIGTGRWRMVFPYPYYESAVDVMELTPIAE